MEWSKQLEMNNQLYRACVTQPADYGKMENLLKAGAQPLGSETVSCSDSESCLYSSIIGYYVADDDMSGDLYRITQLFLKYGMDISRPPLPYDDDWRLHPLWMCSFLGGDELLKTMRLLLENGLDADACEICCCHAYVDLMLINPVEMDYFDVFYKETIRKIMLFASFAHILHSSRYLQELFWYSRNSYPAEKFREWDMFYFAFEGAMIKILREDNGEEVWKFSIVIDP